MFGYIALRKSIFPDFFITPTLQPDGFCKKNVHPLPSSSTSRMTISSVRNSFFAPSIAICRATCSEAIGKFSTDSTDALGIGSASLTECAHRATSSIPKRPNSGFTFSVFKCHLTSDRLCGKLLNFCRPGWSLRKPLVVKTNPACWLTKSRQPTERCQPL